MGYIGTLYLTHCYMSHFIPALPRTSEGKMNARKKYTVGEMMNNCATKHCQTDLLRSCGCGCDSWEGDCPNTNGLWTRE